MKSNIVLLVGQYAKRRKTDNALWLKKLFVVCFSLGICLFIFLLDEVPFKMLNF